MSIFFFDTPAYAETHFKFKLPWSLLYRPWPEVIVDAPFQFVPGVLPRLYIAIRDAHMFPVVVKSLCVRFVKKSSEDKALEIFERNYEIAKTVREPFAFLPVDIDELSPGYYDVHAEVLVRREDGKCKKFKRWNLPFLRPEPLKIHVLAEPLPKAPGFVVGETHCHSYYSADHVEFGAAPAVLQEAAHAVGLDFVSITDHAYDFAFEHVNYTVETDAPSRFEALKNEVSTLPKYPLMLAGEEVSVGNSKGENVHVTVLGTKNYLPGLGDCGRYWLNNKPTLKIEKMLSMTEAPCFAAHPFQQMNALEKFIFRRGYWTFKDLCKKSRNPVCGFQFWNGLLDDGFKQGRNFWIEELSKKNFILPIAGNDAHGDLNDTTTNALPLFALRHTRDHVFGFARTAVKLGGQGLTQKDLQNAFLNGAPVYITNGPALWFEESGESVRLNALSNNELGAFRFVRIFGRRQLPNGELSKKEELLKESLVAAPVKTEIKIWLDDFAYLRAECETSTKRFAMTSAMVMGKR